MPLVSFLPAAAVGRATTEAAGVLRFTKKGSVRHCRRRTSLVLALAVLLPAAATAPAGAHPAGPATAIDAVSVWNANAGKAAVAACISPVGPSPAEARLYAMTHVAIHDALNAIDRRSRPYVYDARAPRGASPDAAVAAAAHDVLVPVLSELSTLVPPACVDAAVASVERDYVAALGAVPNGRAKRLGVAVGHDAAAAILTLRATDGAQMLLVGDPAYPQGTLPGEYRFTPGTPFAFAPRLGELTPFVLGDGSQFRPGPPHPVTDPRYTADFNEIKRLGGNVVTTASARTPDQTQIALFWVESSPLQWNRIARTVSTGARLDMWAKARLFGLLNMALTDGYIGSFETKYHYNYWRPVTAIRAAATDGNPATVADATWTPLVETPAIPDYDSGHAVQGGAAAKVLQRFFGTDHIGFRTCSTTLPAGSQCGEAAPVFRAYSSFSQAADENGLSRILVGFHFREAVEVGIAHGARIGRRAVDLSLQPVRDRHHGGGQDGEAVLDWNKHALDALANAPTAATPGAGMAAPVQGVHLAMVQGAVYDAVNSIAGGYAPYLDVRAAPSSASQAAATATAAHDALVAVLNQAPLTATFTAAVRQAIIDRLDLLERASIADATATDGAAAVADGVDAGEAAAVAMIAARAGDGRWGPFRFTCGEEPGQWRPITSLVCTTPSGPSDPFAWVAKVDPFVVESNEQFLSGGPPALNTGAYAKQYNEVKTLGAQGSARTSEQQALVDFFQANPVEMYYRSFRTYALAGGLDLAEQARLFAEFALANGDAFITCWESKAHWSNWRPQTAIRLGADDGNRKTDGDPTWTPAVATPPYPDVASGYNCTTGSFMKVAELYFGHGRTTFTLAHPTGMTREYRHFRDVVDDTVDARVYQGIHFRSADELGAKLGRDVARWVEKHALQRVR